MRRFRRRLFFLIVSFPSLTFAQTAPTTFAALAGLLVQIITAATAALIGFAVAYYLWTLALSIYKSGQGGAKAWENLRTLSVWGILIFFVIFMIWALIHILGNTLFGTGNNYFQVGL